ncbi:MAG: rod-binding protein [Deferribacteraceae bacterium]|jgi:flagellar protein FlgJ|nr:rod-binding protein [Deferribacteraceae bacterium]
MITTAGSATAGQAIAQKNTRTEEDKLREACQGFEAIFTHQMLKTMRTATMDGGLIKKSNAEKIFTDMLDQEMAEIQSKTSRNGIADMLFEQLKTTLVKEYPENGKNGKNTDLRGCMPRRNGNILNKIG